MDAVNSNTLCNRKPVFGLLCSWQAIDGKKDGMFMVVAQGIEQAL